MRINGCRVRRDWVRHWVVVAGCVALTATAGADIIEPHIVRTLDVEARAVSADEHVLDAPEIIISDDFGLFDRAHDADAHTSDGRAGAEVLATQETFAEPDQIRGRLSTGGAARTEGERTESRAAGNSSVIYEFVLTEAARFALVGDYITREEDGHFANHSFISLVPGHDTEFEPIVLDDPGHFRFLGALPAGEYRLEVQTELAVEAEGEGLSSLVAVIEFRFGLSDCPADINADGELDADDFFAFLDLFAADDLSVDFNHDGTIDSADFFAFLDLFVHGC